MEEKNAPRESRIDFVLRLLSIYLDDQVDSDRSSPKSGKDKLLAIIQQKLFAHLEGDLSSLEQGLVYFGKSGTKTEPFKVLVEQLGDGLNIVLEAESIARLAKPFVEKSITGKSSEQQLKMEEAFRAAMTFSEEEDLPFDTMLDWMLDDIDILVKDPELRRALGARFATLGERVEGSLSHYHEQERTGPLPSVNGVPGRVFQKGNKKRISFKRRRELSKFFGFIFGYVVFRALARYVRAVKDAENPDLIE